MVATLHCYLDTEGRRVRGRDRWALAQLSVDHLQLSKVDYLARIAAAREPVPALRVPPGPVPGATVSTRPR